ncbi:MAG: hypothetical protein ACRCYV_05430 [Aeromonas sp.]
MKLSPLVVAFALLGGLTTTSAWAQTLYTQDKLQGVAVIRTLDISDLPTGKHKFMFEGVEMGTGQRHYVPVIVAKGAAEGKRVLLQVGAHGDEFNGMRIVQRAMDELDPKQMHGSVLAVLGPNRSGIEHGRRHWHLAADGGELVDYNRVQPGKQEGNSAERQAWLLWNNLYRGNVDAALDFHTQSTGTAFPLFIYADYRQPEIQTLAELFAADQIKKDAGQLGSTESTFVAQGIPAITVEVGSPRVYQADMITRGLEGTRNVLVHYGVVKGALGATAKSHNTYIGNQVTTIRATTGGFAEVLVALGDRVKKGQKVALQRNAFGEIIAEYTASMDGKVLAVGTDVLREPQALLVRILGQNSDSFCANGC